MTSRENQEYFCDSRRILATFAKFCLNSLFATWSYRYLDPKHVIQRALTFLSLSHIGFFDVKCFYKVLPLLPIVIAKSRWNAFVISSRHVVFVRKSADFQHLRKTTNQGRGLWRFVVSKKQHQNVNHLVYFIRCNMIVPLPKSQTRHPCSSLFFLSVRSRPISVRKQHVGS